MTLKKFKPQNIPKRLTIKTRLNGYDSTVINYNFQPRYRWFPVDYRLNEQTLSRIFSRLHYLACHSPKKVAIKHKAAYNRFMKQHFPRTFQTSLGHRYYDTWSLGAWL